MVAFNHHCDRLVLEGTKQSLVGCVGCLDIRLERRKTFVFETTNLFMGGHTIEACPVTKTDQVLGTILVQELSQLFEPGNVLTRSNMGIRDYTDCRH